uniref:Uncharacterized protein n=2 Tax=Aegilops tauschii subsp. strangulata TaxID=200361 RepID=A0A453I741_AEGTS
MELVPRRTSPPLAAEPRRANEHLAWGRRCVSIWPRSTPDRDEEVRMEMDLVGGERGFSLDRGGREGTRAKDRGEVGLLDFFMDVWVPLFYGLQTHIVRPVPNSFIRASIRSLLYFSAPGTGHIVEGLRTALCSHVPSTYIGIDVTLTVTTHAAVHDSWTPQ